LEQARNEVATLGGGCFWCVEAVFLETRGITSVAPGYMGGHVENPTYQEVCTGKTGHAEVAKVTFDPAVISYEEILRVFFGIHDPTTPDRQGNDVGPQYRSLIFCEDDRQRETAERMIRDMEEEGVFPARIVTEVRPASTFYPAEDYHREYFRRNPAQAYCAFVVAPKVKKFREKFSSLLG
jgi:peptide-methionine (S)-S-oxide reductase